MKNTQKCSICGARKTPTQPNVSNNIQDIFYVCGGAVTYNIENIEGLEESGNCENKFNWTHILIEYGGEFDESAKLVDERFFGWLEYDLYKKIHLSNWISDNPGKNYLDKEYLDEYFHNKEMYIKKMRDFNGNLNMSEDYETLFTPEFPEIIKKTYTQDDLWLGQVEVIQVERFVQDGFEKVVYKVLSSDEKPKKIGSYILESKQIGGGDSSLDFYDREIIEIINKHKSGYKNIINTKINERMD